MDDLESEKIPDYVNDARTLNKTALKGRYLPTYHSWKNRKHDAKAKGWHWAPEWEDFASFLISMGPRPSKSHSLDRTDTRVHAYGPDFCRWLDAKGQANNRTSTSFVEMAGEKLPLSVAAERMGVKPGVLKRYLDQPATAAATRLGTPYFGKDPRSFQPWPFDCPELGTPAELERVFLLEGGTNIQSRHSFLLQRLKEIIHPLDAWLMDHPEENGSEEFEEKSAKSAILDKLYHQKRIEKAQWLEAKQLFQAKTTEATRRRGPLG